MATFPAASVDRADVAAAVALCSNGDTVTIPAGSATWTSGISISGMAIHIVGAGIGNTIITHDIASAGKAFQFTTTGGYASTISHITFTESANAFADDGAVKFISTEYVPWRAHHLRFAAIKSRALVASGYEGGLIDYCQFEALTDSTQQGVTVYGDRRNSWARPPSWGTARAVYIENCRFEFTGNGGDAAIEMYRGARAVIRYNTIYNASVGAHGLDSDDVNLGSTFSWEIYNNVTILQTNANKPGYYQFRGGSGVLWGNRYWATWQGGGENSYNTHYARLSVYRATGDQIYNPTPPASWPLDGSNTMDGNTAVTNGSGTHTGSNNASTLTDATKSWTTDQHIPVTPVSTWVRPYYIWNLTDGSGGFITANTATTVTATLTGGTDNDWDTGDQYVITFGYPARDQVGRTGPEVVGALSTSQPISPCYMWDNIHNEGLGTQSDVEYIVASNYATSLVHPNGEMFNVEGREFFNNTQKPGYVPLAYPHPTADPVGDEGTGISFMF